MSNIRIQRQQANITVSEPRADYHLPIASDTVLGGIKVGNNLSITTDGTLSAVGGEYSLPVASSTTLGGIKVGEKLSITNGVLSADVDSVLNVQSTNPIANAVVTSALNALDNTATELDDRLDTIETNYGTLSNTVTSHTNSISTLNSSLSSLSDTVDNQGSLISTNTSNISQNTEDISNINSSLSDLSGTVTNQGTAIDEMAGEINDFTISNDTDVEYSYLLPVNTWSSGTITYSRRGKTGLIQFDLAGAYDLQSSVDSQIYQLPATFQNAVVCSGVLITDDGTIEVKLDMDRNIQFYNHDSSTKHISIVKGQLVVVLE